MEFVSFDLAKKLKKKGLTCKYPLAMYNERGSFCPLFTSADRNPNIKSVFGNREYYDYDDFDENDFIAPTISQVLKWLRDEKKLYLSIEPHLTDFSSTEIMWIWDALYINSDCKFQWHDGEFGFDSYEKAAVSAIEYVIDNLI